MCVSEKNNVIPLGLSTVLLLPILIWIPMQCKAYLLGTSHHVPLLDWSEKKTHDVVKLSSPKMLSSSDCAWNEPVLAGNLEYCSRFDFFPIQEWDFLRRAGFFEINQVFKLILAGPHENVMWLLDRKFTFSEMPELCIFLPNSLPTIPSLKNRTPPPLLFSMLLSEGKLF